eukprot:3797556-Prymnesium_polylepis.1
MDHVSGPTVSLGEWKAGLRLNSLEAIGAELEGIVDVEPIEPAAADPLAGAEAVDPLVGALSLDHRLGPTPEPSAAPTVPETTSAIGGSQHGDTVGVLSAHAAQPPPAATTAER